MNSDLFTVPTEIYLVQKFQNGGQAWFSYGSPSPCYIRYSNGDAIWLRDGAVVQILTHNGLKYALNQQGEWYLDTEAALPENPDDSPVRERISCLD